MQEFLYLDKMLTPKLITYLYWLLLVIIVINGLVSIFTTGLIKGIICLVAGVIGARVFCELMIVIFKINDALQDIRNK